MPLIKELPFIKTLGDEDTTNVDVVRLKRFSNDVIAAVGSMQGKCVVPGKPQVFTVPMLNKLLSIFNDKGISVLPCVTRCLFLDEFKIDSYYRGVELIFKIDTYRNRVKLTIGSDDVRDGANIQFSVQLGYQYPWVELKGFSDDKLRTVLEDILTIRN